MKANGHLNRQERIEKAMQDRKRDICLVLENLYEESNIAAILRTCEAFGVGKVCIVHPEGKKPRVDRGAAKGAVQWLEIEYFTSITSCKESFRATGFEMIGALVDPEAQILWDEDFGGKVAIVVGNEAQGLSEEAIKLMDRNVYLPMIGLTESLNVSVAASIFLYEMLRQKEKIAS